MKLYNKKLFLKLQDYNYMNGEYFKIILLKKNIFFYYNYNDSINCLNFKNFKTYTVLNNVYNHGFEIIEKDNELYLFLGSQNNKILNRVSLEKKFKVTNNTNKQINTIVKITNYITNRNEKVLSHLIECKYPINGIYIYKSKDGFNWVKITKKPIMSRFYQSDKIKIGEIDFDTKPSIIKFNDIFFYYGRLNPSRQERKIYLRKSKDLFEWEDPIPIEILNEKKFKSSIKNNYYHLIPFIYNKKLYSLIPFFRSILHETHNEYKDGCTLILQSNDGIKWRIIGNMLRFNGKYKSRINDVKIISNKILIYTRDNIDEPNPIFIKYNLSL